MFKISEDKKTSWILAAALALGILFLLLLILRLSHVDYEGIMPAKGIPTYPKAVPEKGTVDVVKERVPEGRVSPWFPMAIRLPLRLVGIFEQGNEKIAYIENLAAPHTGEYRIGDTIMGAKVIQILTSQVVLLKDGNRIVLTLGKFYAFEGRDEWIGAISDDNFVVSRPELNRRVRDINEVLSEAIPLPHVEDGKIKGIKLSSLKTGGIVNQAGFEENDIVKSINGQSIDSLKKPIQIYEELRDLVDREDAPAIKIEFERGNKTRTFTYRILKD